MRRCWTTGAKTCCWPLTCKAIHWASPGFRSRAAASSCWKPEGRISHPNCSGCNPPKSWSPMTLAIRDWRPPAPSSSGLAAGNSTAMPRIAVLIRHFDTRDLSGFGADELGPALGAAGALFEYARATQAASIAHVRSLAVERDSEYVRMDAATRRNLEISETLRGDPDPTLLSLLDTCATTMGSRWLRHALHHPLRDRTVVAARLDAVAILRGEGAEGPYRKLHEALRPVSDVERITARIALRNARPRDLSALRETLTAPPRAQIAAWAALQSTAGDLVDRSRPAAGTHRTSFARDPAGTRSHHPRRRCHQRRLRCRAGRTARDPEQLRRIPDCAGSTRTRPHRHRQSESRIQPRARFLHRSDQRQCGKGPGRLPPPADAEECRTLHHAGTEDIRGQGAVRAGSRAGPGKISLRKAARRTCARAAAAAAPGGGAGRTGRAGHACRTCHGAELFGARVHR